MSYFRKSTNNFSIADDRNTKRCMRSESDRAMEQAWVTDRITYAIDNGFTDAHLRAYVALALALGFTSAANVGAKELEERDQKDRKTYLKERR
jgi:hypothetical protein